MSRTAPSICIIVLVAALGAAQPAAAQAPVLFANFDLDTPGAAPSSNLPGEPEGDTLLAFASGGTILVQSAMGGLDQQPLVMTHNSGVFFGLQLSVAPSLRDCPVYTVRWRQILDREVPEQTVYMKAPGNLTVASVGFQTGGAMAANGATNLQATYAAMVVKEIEVRLDFQNETVDVSVDGAPDAGAQGLAMMQAGTSGLAVVTVNFGTPDPSVLGIDDIVVTGEECPALPTVDTSWGSMKAAYR